MLDTQPLGHETAKAGRPSGERAKAASKLEGERNGGCAPWPNNAVDRRSTATTVAIPAIGYILGPLEQQRRKRSPSHSQMGYRQIRTSYAR